MTYHLARGNDQLGTFEQSELQAALASGRLQPTDLCWCEGMGDWEPLSSVVQIAEAPVAPAVPATYTAAPPPMPQGRPMPAMAPMAMSPTKTSGMAITSLVLGILSVGFGCLTGVLAIVFGAVATAKIGKSGGTLGGRGMAITGIVLGAVMSLFGTAILAGLAVPAFSGVQERARMLQAANNARQILIAMKSYAADHNGAYPDADPSNPQTANDAFRALIKMGLLEDERVFSAPASFAAPDNNIGEAPDFAEALEAGEDAWALTKGLNDSMSGNLPLIFQAPVNADWPPVWNANVAGLPKLGASWKGGKVIIGRNDGSVNPENLESARGEQVPLKVPLFDPSEPRQILMPAP